MKGTTLARTLFGLAVLILVGATALAQDSRSTTITINGGRTTVQMKAPSKIEHNNIKPPSNPFYDNIGTGGYQAGIGWTISDGSPIGTEYTPGNQIVSLRSGTTSRIKVGVGWVQGTNAAYIVLDKDCNGIPCGTIDRTHICRGKVENSLPTFGQSSTKTVGIACTATLKKGSPYWVYIASQNNSWLAWNFSNSALGGLIEGTNDVWGTPSSNANVGALTIK